MTTTARLLIVGPQGSGKGTQGARIAEAIRPLLDESASRRPAPCDWVYVNNFIAPQQPLAITVSSRPNRRNTRCQSPSEPAALVRSVQCGSRR